MVSRSLHHKEILLSEPGRNRRECILTLNSPYLKSDQQIDVPAEQLLHLTPKTLGNVPRLASFNK